MNKIFAIIVTFNREELLKRTLNSIINQSVKPQRVLVVNNASADGTAVYLDSLLSQEAFQDCLEVHHLSQNTGGAGGFNFGIQQAYHSGAEGFWLMDDDCILLPTALEKLLAAEKVLRFPKATISETEPPRLGFLASRVVWTDGSLCAMNIPGPTLGWLDYYSAYQPYFRLSYSSFVSCLVTRQAVEVCGLPIPEFFIWHDDIEFLKRLTRNRFAGFLVYDSVVEHHMNDNRGSEFGKIDRNNLWKFLYGVRNQAAVITSEEKYLGPIRAIHFLLRVYLEMKKGGVGASSRRAVIAAGLKGVFFFRVKKLIPRVSIRE